MKKTANRFTALAAPVIFALAAAALLVGCRQDPGPRPPRYFTVGFDADGGRPEPAYQSVRENGRATVPVPQPDRTGYSFTGWFYGGDTDPFAFADRPVTLDITLTARWARTADFTVSFDTGDGPTVNDQSVAPGRTASRPPVNPTLDGYRFADWVTAQGGNDFFDFDAPVNADLTVYARWLRAVTATHYLPGAGGVPMRMTNIPRGRFIMGDAGRSNAAPAHQVTLTRDFYIGVVPVTQDMWVAVMDTTIADADRAHYGSGIRTNPSRFRGGEGHWHDSVLAGRPVENMSWYDAAHFANVLSVLAELTPVYTITDKTWQQNPYWDIRWIRSATVTADRNADGFRLPTSAEWERAARAGTTTRWSFGDEEARLYRYAWYGRPAPPGGDALGGPTSNVGYRYANRWGLYDMHGNVWEWTWDLFAPYATDPALDPKSVGTVGTNLGRVGWDGTHVDLDNTDLGTYTHVPVNRTARVIRGGGYWFGAADTASAARLGVWSSGVESSIGLRLVRNAP